MVHALHLPAENKKAPDFWHLDIVNELASCKEGEIMFSDSQAYARLFFFFFFSGGAFHLIEGEREYHYIRANDFCETGIGLDVPSPLERGMPVKVRYTSDGWRADVEGAVMWCVRAGRVGVSMRSYQDNRCGIHLSTEITGTNVELLLASKNGLQQPRSEAGG